ncbi:MAG TPA: S1-like domain-containing RNA-binding protein [Bacteroidia bacterium]
MLQIGVHHTLEILRLTPPGLFLGDGDKENEVLLPNKYIPSDYEIGDKLKVFVYLDFDDRVVATTLTPKIELGKFALLEMKDNSKFGAFMDWGLEKDLFVPFSEQMQRMRIGGLYLIHLYFDENSGRLVGSQKVRRFLDNTVIDVEEGDEVDIIIADNTLLGVNVIVNGKYAGLVYHDEVYKDIETGMRMTAYVKKIRPGNKLDIALNKQGFVLVEEFANELFEKLKKEGGFLPLNDKSEPEKIYSILGVSKKVFKKAAGALYRQKLILIEENGIRLVGKI